MKPSKHRPTGTETQIGVRLPDSELAALDAWRQEQADVPTRPEAIRRLAAMSLSSAGEISLRALYRAFLSADPTRLRARGFDGMNLDEAIETEFHPKIGRPQGELGRIRQEAENVLRSLDGETGPEADVLRDLLERLAE